MGKKVPFWQLLKILKNSARAISKILFILGLYNFLAYLECVKSYAWSKGHSDPDLSSVTFQYILRSPWLLKDRFRILFFVIVIVLVTVIMHNSNVYLLVLSKATG